MSEDFQPEETGITITRINDTHGERIRIRVMDMPADSTSRHILFQGEMTLEDFSRALFGNFTTPITRMLPERPKK